jgi:hypothetical protein
VGGELYEGGHKGRAYNANLPGGPGGDGGK